MQLKMENVQFKTVRPGLSGVTGVSVVLNATAVIDLVNEHVVVNLVPVKPVT